MKNQNSIVDLVKEVDYQKEYTYDQRVELFNKYGISTSTKYINPIMLLTEHIRNAGTNYEDVQSHSYFQYKGVSHSGAVQTAFNKNLENHEEPLIEMREMTKYRWVKVKWWEYDRGSRSYDYEPIITFREDYEEGVNFNIFKPISFWPKRGFCFLTAAEQFCKDFGYNIKFR